jgi:energy-converting hydrogenase Eha subunit A
LALSVTLIDAVRVPVAVGVKVAEMTQLLPAATELPQVFVWAKSALFVPVIAMLVILSAEVALFATVTFCGALVKPTPWLPNTRLVTDSGGPGASPVPVKLISSGLLLPLLVMLTWAVRAPVALGVKVTEISQL